MAIQLSDHFNYKRLLKFVFPSIIMMVFTSVYGVVDGLFVSNYVGKTAFATINLIMPMDMIFGGVGFMLGTGGSALVAKTLGEQDTDRANRYFSMIIWVTVIVGAVLSVIGIAVIRPVSILLGADEGMLPDCVLYGSIMMGFTITFMFQNAFQAFLITAERPNLFFAVFDWGVAGAAVATGLSQCVGGVIPLIYFLRPNTSLLRLKRTKLEIRPIINACANGASEMVSSVTSSVVGILYNLQLLQYAGENGVASYGVLMYVQFVFAAIFLGYSMGSAPIISYHYGAEKHGELKNLFQKSVVLMGTIGGGMVVAAQLFAVPLSRLFVGYDATLFEMTVHAIRIAGVSFLIMGFNIFASAFFTALNNGGVSAVISFLRTFVFKLAAVLLLPLLLGLEGIWWAEVTAEISAFVLSLIFLFINRKKYHYVIMYNFFSYPQKPATRYR